MLCYLSPVVEITLAQHSPTLRVSEDTTRIRVIRKWLLAHPEGRSYKNHTVSSDEQHGDVPLGGLQQRDGAEGKPH